MNTSSPRTPSALSVVSVADGRLSARGWRWAVASTVAILALVLLVLGAVGALPFAGDRVSDDIASDIGGSGGTVVVDGSGTVDSSEAGTGSATASSALGGTGTVLAEWDGPVVNLDWRGREYARAEAGFLGDRVAVPGDRVERSLTVANGGPGAAVMTVTVSLRETIAEAARNPDLGDDVILFWEVNGVAGRGRFSDLVQSGRIDIGQAALARGAATQIMLGFELPAAVESSRAAGAPSTVLELVDVGVEMKGDTAARLPVTGGIFSWIPLIAGAVLLLAGTISLLAIWRRRVRCAECENVIRSDDVRVELREAGRRRRVLCVDCASHLLST
ncbi:hypothetical protein JVX92_01080 [Microbacterium hominis]|uniref:hypothetical protein n=1 Tax=Microbacterium hominis TaxID=162426 RepID=UPI001964A07F|nr:hypothetical protein [Microbacterium hominis]QRY40916.1 hypothetical protein JVX92_01080 [Microbacterium hominis]